MAWKFNIFTGKPDYYEEGSTPDPATTVEIIHVANFSALPDPTTVGLYDIYIVDNAQGNKFWYGSIGGTYYPAGAYYSDLTKWIYSESASKATQAEVNAGTDTEKYVTPETLVNASKWSSYVPYTGAVENVELGAYDISSNRNLIGPNTSANFTRFPNALSAVSNVPSGIQHNESLYIGSIAEGVSVGNTWASGIYGVGYTNSTGSGRGTGVTGEGHVSASTDTGVCVGVRGYSNDVHVGNYNIGLYGDASNGTNATYGGNVALFLANGNIVTSAAAAKSWYLGGNLIFDGQGTSKTISAVNGATFDLGISALNDVTITSPTVNQVLEWNGSQWVNGSGAAINAGPGVIYFLTDTSAGFGTYEYMSKTPDVGTVEIEDNVLVNNNTVLIHEYISDVAINKTTIDAGIWEFNFFGYVDTLDASFIADVYKRTAGGLETLLFSTETALVTWNSADISTSVVTQPKFSCNTTDKLVVKISGKTTNASNVNLKLIHSGADHYSHLHTPLVLAHNDLAGLQGGAANEYYHLSSAVNTKLLNWNSLGVPDIDIQSASTWNAKQAALSGTGFVKISGETISYDNTTYAPLNSPSLTGIPLSTTAASGTNTTQIATTAFVQDAIAKQPEIIHFAGSNEDSVLTVGTLKTTFRAPFAMTVIEVRASLNTAGTTSGITTIDINENGTSILSTKLTIDLTEKTSVTATIPAVISDATIADDAEISIDVDTVSGGATEKGLKILMKVIRL